MSAQLSLHGQRGVRPRQTDSVEALFAEWWSAYPRKVALGHALRAYRTALRIVGGPTEQAALTLLEAVRRYRFSPDPQYRPHPATWLNGRRWLDDDGTGGIDPVLAAAGLKPEDF